MGEALKAFKVASHYYPPAMSPELETEMIEERSRPAATEAATRKPAWRSHISNTEDKHVPWGILFSHFKFSMTPAQRLEVGRSTAMRNVFHKRHTPRG